MDNYRDDINRILRNGIEIAWDKGYMEDDVSEFVQKHFPDEEDVGWKKAYELIREAMHTYFD